MVILFSLSLFLFFTPVLKDVVKEAFDLNERILELLVTDIITEAEAFLLFVHSGVTSVDEPPSQGWHRVYPPLPVTDDILAALRAGGRHLYAPSPPTLSLRTSLLARRRRQVEALQRSAQAKENQQQHQ